MKPGLTSEEARSRLLRHGPNEIAREPPIEPWVIFAGQFKGAMIWLLFGACGLSAVLGQVTDAVAILAIVIVNALVGFFQEYRSERAVLALRSMTTPRARVMRDGHAVVLPAAEVVPGDLLLLDAGDIPAADARLLEASELRANEAALTGESLPAEKSTSPVAPDVPLAERSDHVFMGTAIASGTAVAEVVATGMRTELGKIAGLLSTTTDEATPLQARLERVGRSLIWACLGIVCVVALLGLSRGQPWLELLMTSVSLAVAAVPEGLAAIVTVALAVGLQRMAARNVLIRRLQSVETLGCASVICTDKTGTLTTGVMAVRELWGADQARLLDAAAACCDAHLGPKRGQGTGDPTEIAILIAAAERGIERRAIETERPRRAVHPFDATRKRMSIFRGDDALYVKGAPELLLPLCVSGATGALDAAAEMAARGLRVLAVALGTDDEERDLDLLGLIGLADPPRPEAIEAVSSAREAGIRTVMITGDHPITARAIARELGIVRGDEDPSELVHARATPEQKLEIVRHWKKRGEIVAMTGDGVNDAPALREAHVGIAMGRTGTEVAREASDMILTDDDFASIVSAVREGRGVFDAIRKTLVYLLAGNAGELMVMLGASLLGLPLPLLPLQLLWINLVTDGLPALALVLDPPDSDVLARPPRRPDEPVLGGPEWRTIAVTGVIQTLVVLGVFVWVLREHGVQQARNAAFTVIVFAEIWRALAARSRTLHFWQIPATSNVTLLVVVAVSTFVQIAIHYVPFTRKVFALQPLAPGECVLALALGSIPLLLLELLKAGSGRNAAAA